MPSYQPEAQARRKTVAISGRVDMGPSLSSLALRVGIAGMAPIICSVTLERNLQTHIDENRTDQRRQQGEFGEVIDL
jgi:hypothetical protein